MAPIPAIQEATVRDPFVGAELRSGEGHPADAAALPTQDLELMEQVIQEAIDDPVKYSLEEIADRFKRRLDEKYSPRHQEVCLRCGSETMVWATSSLHCTRCGFHEGCCG